MSENCKLLVGEGFLSEVFEQLLRERYMNTFGSCQCSGDLLCVLEFVYFMISISLSSCCFLLSSVFLMFHLIWSIGLQVVPLLSHAFWSYFMSSFWIWFFKVYLFAWFDKSVALIIVFQEDPKSKMFSYWPICKLVMITFCFTGW